jgi:hypothetical protein
MPFSTWVEQKVLPAVLRVHDAVYRRTNGWVGHPTLMGALTYARDGDDYLVASRAGDAL